MTALGAAAPQARAAELSEVGQANPREIRPGVRTPIAAAYTPRELQELTQGSELENCTVSSNPLGVAVAGVK